MDWADTLRDELKNLLVETLVNLAAWNVKQRHYASAKNLYKKALDKEPYRDDIHLAFIHCLVYSGASNAALAHYLEYQIFLKKEGMEPTKTLQDYYQSLIR